MKNKKLIGEILFLLLVFGVTVYMVLRGEDLHQTLSVIAQVRKLWLMMSCQDSAWEIYQDMGTMCMQ